MKTSEMQELMGTDTTPTQAEAMLELLAERDLTVDTLSDDEFFRLIPEAIVRAK